MADTVISLAERLAAKRVASDERPVDDEDLFLLEEGLDLLASYRSITDRAMRQRIRDLIDAVARGEVIPALAKVTPLDRPPTFDTPRSPNLKRGKAATAMGASRLEAGILLEIFEPAPSDVAVAAACQEAVEPVR